MAHHALRGHDTDYERHVEISPAAMRGCVPLGKSRLLGRSLVTLPYNLALQPDLAIGPLTSETKFEIEASKKGEHGSPFLL